MRNLHEFKVDEKEFLGFLFNYRKSLIINKTEKVLKGDYARLFEMNELNEVVTGRNLLFEILNISAIRGMSNTKDIYYIDLKKVNKY